MTYLALIILLIPEPAGGCSVMQRQSWLRHAAAAIAHDARQEKQYCARQSSRISSIT